ncbi:DUF2314 domain-containing protein [Lacinutrix sp. MEBiC02595]
MNSNIQKKISSLLTIGIIATLAFVLFGIYVAQDKYEPENEQTEWDKKNTREIDSNDKLLNETKQTAELNLPYFISEFKNKENSETDFFAKVKITENENIEHIWVQLLDLNEDNSIGLLSNVPTNFKELKYLDTLTFNINKAEDLMIMRNDSIIFGGFLQAELDNK